jgi:hypothetical protein
LEHCNLQVRVDPGSLYLSGQINVAPTNFVPNCSFYNEEKSKPL